MANGNKGAKPAVPSTWEAITAAMAAKDGEGLFLGLLEHFRQSEVRARMADNETKDRADIAYVCPYFAKNIIAGDGQVYRTSLSEAYETAVQKAEIESLGVIADFKGVENPTTIARGMIDHLLAQGKLLKRFAGPGGKIFTIASPEVAKTIREKITGTTIGASRPASSMFG